MYRLELKNIRKTFGHDVVAVGDVSLSVENGEFLTLLGPSGCGKTTLLRLIAGLETPGSGSILIDGKDVTPLPPAKRDVAMVFQNYALYPHMKVFDNIATGLRLKKVAKEQQQVKVKEVAATLGIDELLGRLPKELSGGQRQRVALARALVRQPRLFLLDEPLSNLDAVLREKTRAELKLLFSRIGGTVIYVTHDQVEAMSLSDRVAVINNGRVLQSGTPNDIYSSPVNRFVAGFVGSPSISFVDAQVENGTVKFGEYSVEAGQPDSAFSGPVVAGIRPEDVLTGAVMGDGAKASVTLVEQFGSFAVATLDHAGFKLKALVIPGSFTEGMNVSFKINGEKIHLFDRDTGSTLTGKKKS